MTNPAETPAATGTAVAAPARKLDLGAIEGQLKGGGAMFLPSTMQECLDFATIMSKSDFAIPPPFRGNPGACLAVTIQASRWQADPFGVIQKAYVTTSKGGDQRIGYEAQLVAAVVNTRANLHGRLMLVYSGEGDGRKVKVIGKFADTGEEREIETPPIKKIHPKNSPLWTSDPDQQLAYYGMRAWGRRWVPEVLLGIYTPEEIEGEIVDAPRPARPTAPAPRAIESEGIVRAAEPEAPVQAAAVEVPTPQPEPEPVVETPITGDEAARMDNMRVDAHDGENRATPVADNEDEEEPEDGPTDAFVEAENALKRSIAGLQGEELRTEADFDNYGGLVKKGIQDADGLTDDEKDDLRARFVSALLNVKRDRGFGRRR